MKRLLIFLFCLFILTVNCVYGKDVNLKEKYMEDTGNYRYYMEDDYYIESSTQLGTIVKNIVRITYNDYVNVVLYKDGEVQPYKSGDYIFGDGEYTVVVKKDNDIGRIKFIMSTVSAEDYDLENQFYKNIRLVQSYDSDRKMFVESMGGYFNIYTNVPNMAITDKSVKIYSDEDEKAYITVTKDGEEISFSRGKTYSEPGYYCVNIVYEVDNSQNKEDMSNINESDLYGFSEEKMAEAEAFTPETEDIMSSVANVAEYKFTIIDKPQNRLNYIMTPQDYSISSVLLDGKSLKINNENCFKSEKDGKYRILFKSKKEGLPDYNLQYERDTKSPKLTFEGLDEKGIAKKELVIVKNDKNSNVEITSSDTVIDFNDDIIDKSGLYKIKVTDEAGNYNTYMINVSFPMYLSLLWVIPVLILAGLGLYMYIRYIKNNIQIR